MKTTISSLFFLLISIFINAQEAEMISFVVNEPDNKYEELLVKNVFEELNTSISLQFQLFHFNEEKQQVIFKGQDEKFSKIALIVDPQFNNSITPEIIIDQDTSGKVNSAYMDVSLNFTNNYKVFDIGSSQVISAKHVQMKSTQLGMKPERIQIDVKKYFKGKLPEKNSKIRKKIDALIYADYKTQISNHYLNRIKKDNSVSREIRSNILSISDNEPFLITPLDAGKNRISKFTINAGKNQDISTFELIEVFKKANLNEVQGFMRIGSAIVTKSQENESNAKFVLSGGKALKEAVDEGALILGVRNTKLLVDDISIKEDVFRVSLEKSCAFCDFEIQAQLSSLYFIKFIDRGDDFISKSFIEKYKTEKFIDDKVEDVIGTKEGVNYIITTSDKSVNISNTETGQILAKEKDKYKNDVRSIFLNAFEPKMKYIGVAKEKKGKIKRVFVYSPYGFKTKEYINVNLVTFEEVSGKKYARTKQIGTAQFVKNHIDLVGEFILQRHAKNVSAAILEGATLSFEY